MGLLFCSVNRLGSTSEDLSIHCTRISHLCHSERTVLSEIGSVSRLLLSGRVPGTLYVLCCADIEGVSSKCPFSAFHTMGISRTLVSFRAAVLNPWIADHWKTHLSDGLRNPWPYICFGCYFIAVILLLGSVSVPKTVGNTCFLSVVTLRLRTVGLGSRSWVYLLGIAMCLTLHSPFSSIVMHHYVHWSWPRMHKQEGIHILKS